MFQSTQLSYYQKNTHEAFAKGFTIKLNYEHIDGTGEVYEVHKYYLPISITHKVRWLKQYFENLINNDISIKNRRHKHWLEYAETSLLMLLRISQSISKNQSIIAGSSCASPIAWAVFGSRQKMAKNYFVNLFEISNHYKNELKGACYPTNIYFRRGSLWASILATKFDKQPYFSPNFWMSIALSLTYDIIYNCGPDCVEFFELFENDIRENAQDYNLSKWAENRCSILGVPKKFEISRHKPNIIVIDDKKPIKIKTKIELIFDGEKLLCNEKTYPTKTKTNRKFEINDEVEVISTFPEIIGKRFFIEDFNVVNNCYYLKDCKWIFPECSLRKIIRKFNIGDKVEIILDEQHIIKDNNLLIEAKRVIENSKHYCNVKYEYFKDKEFTIKGYDDFDYVQLNESDLSFNERNLKYIPKKYTNSATLDFNYRNGNGLRRYCLDLLDNQIYGNCTPDML